MKATTHYGLFYEHGRDLDVHGATLTQIGQVALMTGDPQVVMHLHLGVQWLLGAARNSLPLLCLARKQSIEEQLWLHVTLCG